MIPLNLYMRNFMCYREQALDFRGIHLACLTGNNGHGKSAILDAMTWALWGYSRVGARRDDELIHLGQHEMEVEFEFELADGTSRAEAESAPSPGGLRYRVIRKRSKRGRRGSGQSSFDLHGWDAAESKFRSLSEPTISGTQGKVDGLLRMDYDTFINSAFLLQGRADEFTIKRPAERKRVLGDILGLGRYDEYEQWAKEAAQERKTRADQLVAAVEQIDRELAREPEYEAAVKGAEEELARLQQERAATEEAYNRTRTALQEAEAAQQQVAALQRRMSLEQRETDRLAGEMAKHGQRLDELEGALAQEGAIEAGFETYRQAMAQNEALNAKLGDLIALNEERGKLERQIATARHELDIERLSAAQQLRQLQETAAALDQEAEWQQVQAGLIRLDAREAERAGAQDELQVLAADVATLAAENKRAETDAAQIKEKIDLLSRQAGEGEGGACCPLCGQSLAGDECARLLTAFQADLAAEREAYAERAARVRAHRQRTSELESAVSEIDRELRQRTGLQRKEAALAHVIQEARGAQQAMPQAEEALQAIEDALERGAYAEGSRQALSEVERQLGDLGYDADAHRQVQADVERLRPYEGQMQTLREARSSLETVRLAISQLQQSQAEAGSRLEADREQAEGLQRIADQLPALQRQAIEARQVLEGAHDRAQAASLRLGAARNKLEHCADLRQQRVKRGEEERALRQEQGIYDELRRAFGKNGVQAMLIESAIPEIEEEANRLLARMTRGAMQVRFETQRDTQKGDTIETLDIHIADALGTRSYETYSGGERYRINFAIRIALSKLLARRAGAQLQMLVMDEGFGTQDNEGRDGLIDAINAVRDDFACILVITHIEELKDAFNVRIEVEKTARGSEITVV